MSMHEKRKRIAAFLLACIAVFGSVVLSGCGSGAPTDQSVDTASVESDNSVTELNDHITLYTNVDASFVKENIGYDGEVSANTANFSRAEQKLVCFPNQGTAAVITGVEAITGYDSGRICYKTTDSAYFEFDFSKKVEISDSRFVVPDDAVEYKLGLDGKLYKYNVNDKTCFCLVAYDTIKYFELIKEQNEDYFGNSKYNMCVVRELGEDNGLCDGECVTIGLHDLDTSNFSDVFKETYRILILSDKYESLTFYSGSDYVVTDIDILRMISSYEKYIIIGYWSENFSDKMGCDTYVDPIIVNIGNRDYQGNALLVNYFNGDGRSKGNHYASDINRYIPVVPGVGVAREKNDTCVLFTGFGAVNGIMMGYGIKPDDVKVYYTNPDCSNSSRVTEIKVSGTGGEEKIIYYSEATGGITSDRPDTLIPYGEEYVPEE